jgi:heat shock protein HtpX
MVVISIIFNLLGLSGTLDAQGINLDLNSLLVMSAVIGMTGSAISLAMSKWSAKQAMGVHVIEQAQNQTERWLVDIVTKQARLAGIGMPEVGIFQAPEANAFATGMNKNSALVAVSTGLLQNMNADEVEAVVGHEITHVANGDMVTMALMQGVVNTFVYFFCHYHRSCCRPCYSSKRTRPWYGVLHHPNGCTNCPGLSGHHAGYVVFSL